MLAPVNFFRLAPYRLLCYNYVGNKLKDWSRYMEITKMIARINELAHKKKTIGLTPAELAEQKELYKIYLSNIRAQLKAQLDNIEITDKNSVGLQ